LIARRLSAAGNSRHGGVVVHTWTVKEGEAELRCGPLRPHVFGSRLYFRDQAGVEEIEGATQPDGTVSFRVSATQVGEVIAKKAYLFLTTLNGTLGRAEGRGIESDTYVLVGLSFSPGSGASAVQKFYEKVRY
jgi:hypothetical protein